jgi:hypothetical protein
MTFTKEGTQVNIYDFVPAHTVEEGDQIAYTNDLIEVNSVIDSVDSIMVKGFSHVTGDSVTYIISPDTEVGLWTV